MTIRLVLVDDQEMYRTGFRMVLSTRPEFEVVGEADDGDTALGVAYRGRGRGADGRADAENGWGRGDAAHL